MSSPPSTDPAPRRTPLHTAHEAAGGKLVDFAGWLMPIQYQGIVPEHKAVRQSLGVFDISHMGQIRVRGPQTWLDGLLTNALGKLSPGHGQYSLMLNEQGGVIDDLILYQTEPDEWLLVVNASKCTEDLLWLQKQAENHPEVTLMDESDATAGLAVQGPQAAAQFLAWTGQNLPPRNGIASVSLPNGISATICRTGYTGEDGYELFCPAAAAIDIWDALLAQGATPCGLGARDSLRLEMGYPLNGQDLSPNRTPLEAGLGFFVDLGKNFLGSDVLRAQKAAGNFDRLVGFKMIGTCPPPRSHCPVLHAGSPVGEAASGGFGPSVGCGIGMAYLPAAVSKIGTEISIDIRGRLFPAQVVKRPFWKSS